MVAAMLLLPLLLACVDPPAPSHALAPPAEGWGAVLWHDGVAVQHGGGPVLVAPKAHAAASVDAAAAPDRCGGSVLKDAPTAAVLAPPPGSPETTPHKPPAVPAALVEAALWRVDTLLPEADSFTPIDPNAAPAKARGVELGSVVKTRRRGAPPVLVVSGERSCTAVLAVLDAKATRVLASQLVPGVCDVPRVLPPVDLDGDGAPETALFTGDRVVAARLQLASGEERLELLGDWACPAGD
jgi:hypothetical protein